MKVIVTGGAGFIGSCIIRMLNDMGVEEIIVVDNIGTSEKWLNLRNKKYSEYYKKDVFIDKLADLSEITHIIHMGACSSTTENDFDYLYNNNYLYTKLLWNYCKEHNISFIYASSAATYGDGANGFDDKIMAKNLSPLNRYGYSKNIFDEWMQKQSEMPKQAVGLKFFNVYGPNEYHKGDMASMVYHGYNQILKTGRINLFKSYNPRYKDGGQLRDFVYIKDICKVIEFFIEHSEISGLYNVGTGKAGTFDSLAKGIFKAMDIDEKINYIDMPSELKGRYQYYTQADLGKLRGVGYSEKFYSLEEGIAEYVKDYLSNGYGVF